ncbi:hypothetical protein CC80DRAFT_564289, partial [Byssothecium circinans]
NFKLLSSTRFFQTSNHLIHDRDPASSRPSLTPPLRDTMAVLSECPGLVVEIVANDQALREYDDDETDTEASKTVTKYVQVEEESPFEVRFRFSEEFPSEHELSIHVILAGMVVNSTILQKHMFSGNKAFSIDGAWSSVSGVESKHNFRFLRLVAETDSNRALSEEARMALSAAEQIEVRLFHITNLRRSKSMEDVPLIKIGGNSMIPEKATGSRALSHTVKYVGFYQFSPCPAYA